MHKIYKNKLFMGVALFGLTLLAAVSLSSAKALAATVTWDGGGSDKKFSTDANWSGDAAPVDGDTIVFPTSVTSSNAGDRTLDNDISGLSVAGIQFTGTYSNGDTDYYKLTGNTLTLTGNATDASGNAVVDLDVTLGANVSVGVYNFVSANRTLTIGSHDLTLTGSMQVQGSISGSGDITTSSFLYVGDLPSYTGTIHQQASNLSLWGCDSLNHAAGVIIADNAQMFATCFNSADGNLAVPITLLGDGKASTVQNGNYAYTIYNPALTISAYNTSTDINVTIASITLSADSTYGSWLSADSTVTVQSITKNGHSLSRVPGSSGKLVVGGSEVASDYNTIIETGDDTGTYDDFVHDKENHIVNANYPNLHFTVRKGGILGGAGTLGAIDINAGGMLAPGMSPGCLNSGNVTFAEGGIYQAQLGGANVCTGYDQQRVTGTVTLGNATLSTPLWNGYKPAAGSTYTIISNDGADAVVGTFKNLPEGATYTQDGYVIQVSYVGGDGNDVVLTVKSVPKAPNTGLAPLTNNPILTLMTSLGASATILLIAIRRKKMTTATTQK